MPWVRVTEVESVVRSSMCIADQSKVQALETPNNATSNALAILKIGA